MPQELVPRGDTGTESSSIIRSIPLLFLDGREETWRSFIEFFTARIRNPNTREAYARAVLGFVHFCEQRKILEVERVTPVIVAAYVEQIGTKFSKSTVKQHLAAIRVLFDHLVISQVVPVNPAASVRGPKIVQKKGKTPVLTSGEARKLLDSIDTRKTSGLRDRALIAVMVYSFARVGAVVAMNVEDYFEQGHHMWVRLHEKGGKDHDVPVHHQAEEYLDDYIDAIGMRNLKDIPLFRTIDRQGYLTNRRMSRREVLAMVKRRARKAGLPESTCCHTFRATGITAYLEGGGQIEHAQRIAAHESPGTTKLYDRTKDRVSVTEVERVGI